MLRRMAAPAIGVVLLLAGCGAQGDGPLTGAPSPTRPAPPTIGADEAAAAFGLLTRLQDAWASRDCAEVAALTAAAESELAGRACRARRNGRPAPASLAYEDADYYVPDEPGDRPWVAALAHAPDPAYFLFTEEQDAWRLAYGPIPLTRDAPRLDAAETVRAVPADDPEDGLRARLVPQKHLAYLTDPAGLSGVRFAARDAVTRLRDELAGEAARVRPDRLDVDVRLVPGETRALALEGGGALVFHALTIAYRQRGRRGEVDHPLFGAAAVRHFTGKTHPRTLTATELIVLATEAGADGTMRTVALRRSLADITAT
ncbi:hypothetical protein [Sphaerisporangium krabiense]|uniref:DUF8094 domain-containing protein n=1 Tax=Sphaerisporangium krabiense TaxID=763782 RepID=A0A7W8YZK0_9ACTN|nr:hypothetical protein [Sphaerisporangium krabiense]MBB5624717.1 hypothetical protein [Sphaerisporangium krabiense]